MKLLAFQSRGPRKIVNSTSSNFKTRKVISGIKMTFSVFLSAVKVVLKRNSAPDLRRSGSSTPSWKSSFGAWDENLSFRDLRNPIFAGGSPARVELHSVKFFD